MAREDLGGGMTASQLAEYMRRQRGSLLSYNQRIAFIDRLEEAGLTEEGGMKLITAGPQSPLARKIVELIDGS